MYESYLMTPAPVGISEPDPFVRFDLVGGHSDERGGIAIRQIAPTIFFTYASGHLGRAHGESFLALIDAAKPHGRVLSFHDWLDLDSYDAEVRRAFTDWGLKNRTESRGAHILVRSKAIAVGVNISAAAFKMAHITLKAYTSRAMFHSAFRTLMRIDGTTK